MTQLVIQEGSKFGVELAAFVVCGWDGAAGWDVAGAGVAEDVAGAGVAEDVAGVADWPI